VAREGSGEDLDFLIIPDEESTDVANRALLKRQNFFGVVYNTIILCTYITPVHRHTPSKLML